MSDIRDFCPLWGEWEADKRLGSGSFGSVWRVRRMGFNGQIYYAAVKHISIPKDPQDIQQLMDEGVFTTRESASRYYSQLTGDLMQEIDTMVRLQGYTNIVSYEDHKVIPKRDGIGFDVFLRMELLTPLQERIRRGMYVEDVVRLGMDISRAIDVLNRFHIVHRDIKPQNIFVNDTGDYKLGDYGTARALETGTMEMSMKGTFNYMAPEIYKNEKSNKTVDIYSLGLVMYRLLNNNRLPFCPLNGEMNSAVTNEAQIRRISGERFDPPAYADNNLGKIILKACAYKPEDRYQNASELLQELENYHKDSGNLSGPDPKFQDPEVTEASLPEMSFHRSERSGSGRRPEEEKHGDSVRKSRSEAKTDPSESSAERKKRKWGWIARVLAVAAVLCAAVFFGMNSSNLFPAAGTPVPTAAKAPAETPEPTPTAAATPTVTPEPMGQPKWHFPFEGQLLFFDDLSRLEDRIVIMAVEADPSEGAGKMEKQAVPAEAEEPEKVWEPEFFIEVAGIDDASKLTWRFEGKSPEENDYQPGIYRIRIYFADPDQQDYVFEEDKKEAEISLEIVFLPKDNDDASWDRMKEAFLERLGNVEINPAYSLDTAKTDEEHLCRIIYMTVLHKGMAEKDYLSMIRDEKNGKNHFNANVTFKNFMQYMNLAAGTDGVSLDPDEKDSRDKIIDFLTTTKPAPSPTPKKTNATPTPTPGPTPTPIPTPTPTEEPTPTPTPEPTREPVYSTSAEDYLYKEAGGGITLEKYMGDADVVIIPEMIDGKKVNRIYEKCFSNHAEILKVVLPETMRTIEYEAFYGCSGLREMNFPDGLYEIGGWCFAYTDISEVLLPDSLKKLGYGAFYGCSHLTEVVLPPSVVSLGENTFRQCVRLKRVTVPAEQVNIHLDAFESGKKITLVGVPGSYTEKYAKAMGFSFESIP